MENAEPVTAKANPDFIGLYFKETYVPNQIMLLVPHILKGDGMPSPMMVDRLGMVKVKNDGRWAWFRWKQRTPWFFTYSEGNARQGVAGTRLQAMDMLLEGLPSNVDRSLVEYRDKHGKPKVAKPADLPYNPASDEIASL